MTCPIDLLDQRDQLVNSIAERIDIQRYEIVQGELGLGIAGSSISIGIASIQFETVTGADGTVAIHVQGSDRPTNFVSGKIAALTELHNDFVEHFTNKIDEFASALIRQVDQAHAVGVGLNGPYSIMHGTRSVADATASLNDSGLPFPVEAGELFLTVTSSDNGAGYRQSALILKTTRWKISRPKSAVSTTFRQSSTNRPASYQSSLPAASVLTLPGTWKPHRI